MGNIKSKKKPNGAGIEEMQKSLFHTKDVQRVFQANLNEPEMVYLNDYESLASVSPF